MGIIDLIHLFIYLILLHALHPSRVWFTSPYSCLFNCLSLFLVLIGQKSITWQMVFCPTTGDDVSRSLFDWADRSLFTRARPIDSVLQVWLTRAESPSAQCELRAFLNCWANGAERLIRVKAGRKMPKNLWNYMHLSVLQGKTSLMQIVIHLFLLLFHPVYFFYFADPFQLYLSFKTLFAIRFWPCYLSSVFCMTCIGPFKYTGPIAIALSLFASYNSHSALRITKYLRAYWQWKTLMKCAYSIHSRVRRQWKTLMNSRLRVRFTHHTYKTRCDVKIIIFGLVTLNKSNSDLRHGRYTK